MKVYVYENSFNEVILRSSKDNIEEGSRDYLGTLELDIKPEKKVVQKKREFKSIYELSDAIGGMYRDMTNIVVYYDIEE
jgi:hypothetical protein